MRVDTSFPRAIGAAALLAATLIAGPALADFQKGLDAYSGDNYAVALKEWRASADQGDAHSQYGLGLLYDLGRGVPVDPAQAAKWYGLAAAQNVPDAQSNLALLYAEGRGVPKDMARADQLWLDAGKAGNVEAQFNLGLSYYRGEGVAKSYPDAAGWFEKAAEGGSVDGQYAIAEMYRIGRGVPKNISEARKWFTRAAKAGNAAAADRLASLPPDGNAAGPVAVAPPVPVATPAANTPPVTTTAAGGESVNAAAPLAAATKSAGSGSTTGAGATTTQLAPVPDVTTALPPAPTPQTTTPEVSNTTTLVTTPPAPALAPPSTATVEAPPAPATTTAGSGSSNIVTFDTAGGAPAAAPDTGATTTVLTASSQPQPALPATTPDIATSGSMQGGTVSSGGRNGQIPPTNVPQAQGMLVPSNSDVSPTTRVQIASNPTPADLGPPVTPPAKETGAINLGLPISGTAGGTTASGVAAAPVTPVTTTDLDVASIPAGTETSNGNDVFRVWIGTFKTENDALIYWGQEVQRFPDLLKQMKLIVRQVDLGASQGIWYRVLGGPFGTREAAENLCGAIKTRSPADECRVVLN